MAKTVKKAAAEPVAAEDQIPAPEAAAAPEPAPVAPAVAQEAPAPEAHGNAALLARSTP